MTLIRPLLASRLVCQTQCFFTPGSAQQSVARSSAPVLIISAPLEQGALRHKFNMNVAAQHVLCSKAQRKRDEGELVSPNKLRF